MIVAVALAEGLCELEIEQAPVAPAVPQVTEPVKVNEAVYCPVPPVSRLFAIAAHPGVPEIATEFAFEASAAAQLTVAADVSAPAMP
jgi:hypothetical protein